MRRGITYKTRYQQILDGLSQPERDALLSRLSVLYPGSTLSLASAKDSGRAQNLADRTYRVLAIVRLGGKCTRCGFEDIRALQIDHVNGGGRENYLFIRRNSGPYFEYVLSKIGSGEFQVLCANCNWIKKYENHEF